ncbi:MAG: GNAT family N-acetyltransferase [Planctomycetes bacterium]|nr:GNAT family N-acetyltransferase [Planctomycetota bacterium]
MSLLSREQRSRALALMERVIRDGASIAPEYPLCFDERFPGRVLATEEAGRVVSACALLVRDFTCGSRSVRVGLIGSVCTAPEARGRGLASALLRRAEEELAAEGCVLAMLWADDARFYEERGWSPLGSEIDFALEPAHEARLPGSSGLRAAAPDDRGAIHRLYSLHRERVERSPQETAALLAAPGMETLVLQRERDVVAYSCLGRGKDFARTIHEWAGSERDVLALVREHMQRARARGEGGATFLITPSTAKGLHARLRGIGANWSEGVLAMGKLLALEGAGALLADLAGPQAALAIDGGSSVAVRLTGPGGSVELSPEDLLGLLFPARGRRHGIDPVARDTGLALGELPLALFAWGLDSI